MVAIARLLSTRNLIVRVFSGVAAATCLKSRVYECRWRLLCVWSPNGGNRARRSRRIARRRLVDRLSERWLSTPHRYVWPTGGVRSAFDQQSRRIRGILFPTSHARASRWVASQSSARENLRRRELHADRHVYQ